MAKVTAPNLAIGSSGQVGKTLVNAKWRGVSYVRRYVVPANPRTTQQTFTRTSFTFLSAVWKLLNPAVQAAWTLYAKGQPLTDRNAFTKFNLSALRTASTLDSLIASPGAKGGYAAAGYSVAGTSGHVTPTLVAPTIPSDWAIIKAHAIAILQGDIQTGPVSAVTYYAMDASDPYSPSIAVAAGVYVVSGFFEFTNSMGQTVFGPSSTGTATAT
jgi:hypothetical protein